MLRTNRLQLRHLHPVLLALAAAPAFEQDSQSPRTGQLALGRWPVHLQHLMMVRAVLILPVHPEHRKTLRTAPLLSSNKNPFLILHPMSNNHLTTILHLALRDSSHGHPNADSPPKAPEVMLLRFKQSFSTVSTTTALRDSDSETRWLQSVPWCLRQFISKIFTRSLRYRLKIWGAYVALAKNAQLLSLLLDRSLSCIWCVSALVYVPNALLPFI